MTRKDWIGGATRIESLWSLGNLLWSAFIGLGGGGLMAWLSSFNKHVANQGVFGYAIVGLVSAVLLALLFFFIAAGRVAWKGGRKEESRIVASAPLGAHSGAAPPIEADDYAEEAILHLLFRNGQDPLEVKNVNVWRWHVSTVDAINQETAERVCKFAYIVVVFKKPTKALYRSVVPPSDGGTLNVQDLNSRFAVITIQNARTDSGLLTMEFGSKPR